MAIPTAKLIRLSERNAWLSTNAVSKNETQFNRIFTLLMLIGISVIRISFQSTARNRW